MAKPPANYLRLKCKGELLAWMLHIYLPMLKCNNRNNDAHFKLEVAFNLLRLECKFAPTDVSPNFFIFEI